MKRLDQFINIQRERMDSLEPREGHFMRFQEKLNHGRRSSLTWFTRVAAVVLAAALISVNLIVFRNKGIEPLSAELRETEWFYTTQSEKLISEIQNNEFLDNTDKKLVLNDIRNFDQEYQSILSDLKKFPGDERLINAFIDYHRSKIEFLEEIVKQVNATIPISI